MGPIHNEEENHLQKTTAATNTLQEKLSADVKRLKEPLNKMMKVAKFRAKEDAKHLQGEFSKLEQVLSKLGSSDVEDVLAPHKHYFTQRVGDRLKSKIFEFDEVTEESGQIAYKRFEFK